MARQGDHADENAPLLGNNHIVPDSETSPNAGDDGLIEILPSKRVQWHVSATATFMVTAIQFGQTLVVPAMQQITEGNICYARYPDHKLRHFKPADPRCKGPDVQGELAILTSWIAVLDLILRKPASLIFETTSCSSLTMMQLHLCKSPSASCPIDIVASMCYSQHSSEPGPTSLPLSSYVRICSL